jgi:hypothetical protein
MPFEDAEFNAAPPTTRIVIVCLGSAKERVRIAVGSVGRAGWEEDSELKLIVVHDRFHDTPLGNTARQIRMPAAEVLKEVDSAAPPREGARIVVVDRIPFPALPEGDMRSVLRIPTISQFEAALPALLRQAGLDWMSRTILALEHYHQAVVDAAAVQRWLEQFDHIKDGGKSKGWIGRALLKLLDVIPSGKVGDALLSPPQDPTARGVLLPSNWTNAYKRIVCWETSGARSSALVSRYVSKRLGEPMRRRICSFEEIQSGDLVDGRILFLEDCLLTGKECINRIEKLRSLAGGGLHAQVDFKFAVTTAEGICRVRSFLQRKGITGVRVLDSGRPSIDNLTALGWKAASEDALFDENLRIVGTAENVITGLTLRAKGVIDEGRRRHILRFCQVIGEQLMRQYLVKINVPEKDAADIARRTPFGLDNLGLVLAFAHGVPDGTLPLFWVSGDVVIGSEKFTWMPLFPSVE